MIDLSSEECARVLEEGRIAHVGCISEGRPYVTPMSYVVIGGDVCFRTGPGRRVDALRTDPRVCIEVTIAHEDDDWESVLFWGEGRFVTDATLEADVIAALLHKYDASPLGIGAPRILPRENPVIAVTPEDLTGRASRAGMGGATRPGRL
jgi:nitroimidazol reductase NimA-like FMN-containing flavoprotein (pyridoxamine 5'-phosphate oxidase superfamily)